MGRIAISIYSGPGIDPIGVWAEAKHCGSVQKDGGNHYFVKKEWELTYLQKELADLVRTATAARTTRAAASAAAFSATNVAAAISYKVGLLININGYKQKYQKAITNANQAAAEAQVAAEGK